MQTIAFEFVGFTSVFVLGAPQSRCTMLMALCVRHQYVFHEDCVRDLAG